jgi:hypothetical protein
VAIWLPGSSKQSTQTHDCCQATCSFAVSRNTHCITSPSHPRQFHAPTNLPPHVWLHSAAFASSHPYLLGLLLYRYTSFLLSRLSVLLYLSVIGLEKQTTEDYDQTRIIAAYTRTAPYDRKTVFLIYCFAVLQCIRSFSCMSS